MTPSASSIISRLPVIRGRNFSRPWTSAESEFGTARRVRESTSSRASPRSCAGAGRASHCADPAGRPAPPCRRGSAGRRPGRRPAAPSRTARATRAIADRVARHNHLVDDLPRDQRFEDLRRAAEDRRENASSRRGSGRVGCAHVAAPSRRTVAGPPSASRSAARWSCAPPQLGERRDGRTPVARASEHGVERSIIAASVARGAVSPAGCQLQRQDALVGLRRFADEQAAPARASTLALIDGLPRAGRSATWDARRSPSATAAGTRSARGGVRRRRARTSGSRRTTVRTASS